MLDSHVLQESRTAFMRAVAGARNANDIRSALDDVLAWSVAQGHVLTALSVGDQATVGAGLTGNGEVLWRAYPRQSDGAKIVVLPGVFDSLSREGQAALRAAFDVAVPGGEFATAGDLQGSIALLADEVVQRQFRVALAAALAVLLARSGAPAANAAHEGHRLSSDRTSSTHRDHKQVFVILRADLFHGAGAPIEAQISAKEIVHSLNVAEHEVARLNALHPDGQVRYWFASSRLFPPGRSANISAQPA